MSEVLTPKQKLFVDYYLINLCAADAAKAAGYSEKTAKSMGHKLLKLPEIAAAISKKVEKVAMSANEVLMELAAIARADWKDFVQIRYDRNGEMIDATLKLSDKIKALELIGKHHKLFTDKVEVTKPVEAAEVAQALVERLKDAGWTEEAAWAFANQKYQEVGAGQLM